MFTVIRLKSTFTVIGRTYIYRYWGNENGKNKIENLMLNSFEYEETRR